MIKMFGIVAPRRGLNDQEFHDHWRHPHATYVMHIRPVRRYVQCHCIASEVFGTNDTGFAGVAELTFDSIAEAERSRTLPFLLEHNLPDERLFLDPDRRKRLIASEEVIQGGRHGPNVAMADADWSDDNRPIFIKLLQFVQTDGATPWANSDDAELGFRIGAFRHVRSYPVIAGEFLGVRELYWPTLTAFEMGVRGDPEAFATLRSRPAKSLVLLTQVERII